MKPEVRAMLEDWLANGTDGQKAHARARLDAGGSYPPLATQAGSAIKAAVGFVADGLKTVDQAEQERRLAICREACEHFDQGAGRCRLCGCFASLKSRIARESCPIGKW